MNIQHLKAIADLVGFRITTDTAQQIPSGPGGGHICWKINGVKESFFIKQLDPKINVNDEITLARFELCESVAYRFLQQGIPAVSAIRGNNNSVIVLENTAYLVYPWVEGYSLKEISANHSVKIAEILAKIHKINLDVPELEPKFDIHTN